MLRIISDKEKCILCSKDSEKAYSTANRVFWICNRCKLIIDWLTPGLDKDCVKEGEVIDEAELPFDDLEEGQMFAEVPTDAGIPFDDIPIREDAPIVEEQIPFDNTVANVVSDTRKPSGKARKKRKSKVACRR